MSGSRRQLVVCILAVLAASWQMSALAQDLDLVGGPAVPEINIQNFDPTPSPFGVFSVDSAQGSADLQVSGGLLLNFAKDPLVIVSNVGDEAEILVSDQLAADLLFALGLFDFLEFGVSLPVYFVNTAQVNDATIEGATVGDLKLRPKFTLLSPEDGPVGVALYAHLGFPTGDAAAFTSSGSFSLRPGAIIDTKIDKLLLALNVGVDIKEDRQFGDLTVGSEISYGVGAQYEVIDNFLLFGGELFGSTTVDDPFREQDSPLEGLVGVKLRAGGGLNFELGTGGGLIAGFGAPTFRVFGGVRYADFDDDWDDDGILNGADTCPRDPEDRDLFKDEDGCPEPDNDKDGICDPGLIHPSCALSDECPLDPEDKDGFEDENGCPDPDNDKDTVLDVDDECPNVPGLVELRGCPTNDKDKDGILDNVDKCPEIPEDRDLFEDEDGCPDTDNDKDGVLDAVEFKDGAWTNNDRAGSRDCRNYAEDKDKFEDEDGCPDPDNDQDGILDVDDKCPLEPEFCYGYEDEDGCPDKGKPIVTKDLKILEQVQFDTGKATIKPVSFTLLTAVANILKKNKNIVLVEVQGHTDDVSDDAFNLELSDRRANAVRDFLISKGIEADRLQANGCGETLPLIPIVNEKTGQKLAGGALKKARDVNRRVQFEILKPKPINNDNSVRTE